MEASPAIRAWTREEIQTFGYRVVDVIARHLTELPDRPVFRPVPAEEQRLLRDAPLPEAGRPAAEVLAEFEQRIEPYPFGNGHPRFFGWVNSPPAVIGVFAEALAAAMNPSCSGGNHAAVHIERQIVGWFRRLFGFPAGAMGLLVSGGSMATLTALAVARHARAGSDVRARGVRSTRPLVVYKSREGHSCIQKAVELLGLGSDAIHVVDHDDELRMSAAALEAAIRQDVAAGRLPMAVVASAGTVNSGAVDPLDEIADVCERHGVWFHADGAYGAPAILSARYHDRMIPLRRCDSLALDPHKWLYTPIEAGLVLVRNAETMREAFSLVPPYLRTDGNPAGVGGPPWFSEYGFQQTRGFRALKVWMSLKHHGLEGHRAAIEHDLSLADRLAEGVASTPDLELFPARGLSIVCFRFAPPALADDGRALNEINQALLERLQLGGQVFLTSTVIDGVLWLRACIVNYLMTAEDVDLVPRLVSATGAEIAASRA